MSGDSVSAGLASRHYFDRECGRAAVKLLPCEYFVTTDDTAMVTVLGSCVAACLHDPLARVSGMNHFMLPDSSVEGHGSLRYGNHAMDVLVDELLKRGASLERMQAKVFGGGAVLANMPSLNVGDQNARFVLRYLRARGIALHAQDLGGDSARRICMLPETGKVIVKRLGAQSDLDAVRVLEKSLLQRFGGAFEGVPS